MLKSKRTVQSFDSILRVRMYIVMAFGSCETNNAMVYIINYYYYFGLIASARKYTSFKQSYNVGIYLPVNTGGGGWFFFYFIPTLPLPFEKQNIIDGKPNPHTR